MPRPSYILISVFRNEADYIHGLVDTVVKQTVRPTRWVMVDDGSTDETYERAALLASSFDFIHLVRRSAGRARNFSSKVYALQAGWEVAKETSSEFVGFLDADIRQQSDYYERLLGLFDANPGLGVAGGVIIDHYPDRKENIRRGSECFHVPGGVQFFRRPCFESIGGYIPVDAGGEDTIAEVMVMMRGWTVRSFEELTVAHLRPQGADINTCWTRGMKWGRRFYLLGYHPLFYFAQCVRRLGQRPAVVGSLCRLFGFLAATIRRESRPVSIEFVRFHRRLQMQRLRAVLPIPRWRLGPKEDPQ